MHPLPPHVSFTILQPSKLEFLLSCHLATNSFGLRRVFTNQATSSKILGTMASKMLATWRVVLVSVTIFICTLIVSDACYTWKVTLYCNIGPRPQANFTYTHVSSYVSCTFLPETLCDSVHKQHHQHPCSHQIPGKERSTFQETCM